MDEKTLENMKAALEIFYETNGYEDFYNEQLKRRTPAEIYELYEDTFGEQI